MAFVCGLTQRMQNALSNLRAEQGLENADYYGVEKSKELDFLFALQRHFRSLFSGPEELFRLCGAATLVFESEQRKNNGV